MREGTKSRRTIDYSRAIEEYRDLEYAEDKKIFRKNIREDTLSRFVVPRSSAIATSWLKVFLRGPSVRDRGTSREKVRTRHSILTDIGELAEPRYATSRPPNQ